MGLDFVELIMAVEEAFEIRIENQEAGKVSTVGDLYKLVLSKFEGRSAPRCLTTVAFYETRRGLIRGLGLPRTEVKPSTPLAAIFPRRNRRDKWRRFQGSTGLRLPDLRHSDVVVLALMAVWPCLGVWAGLRAHVGLSGFAVLLFLGALAGVISVRLSPALAVAFPNGEVSVGDLVRDVAAINHSRLVDTVGGWNEKDVWDALCGMIVRETGVEREQITPDALFVEDLGLD